MDVQAAIQGIDPEYPGRHGLHVFRPMLPFRNLDDAGIGQELDPTGRKFRSIRQEEVAALLKVCRFAAAIPRLFGVHVAVAEFAINEQ